MTDLEFEKQVEDALPYHPQFYGGGATYRDMINRVVALLKAADTDARQETWGSAIVRLQLRCVDWDLIAIQNNGNPKLGELKKETEACIAYLVAEAEKEPKS